MKKKNAQFEEDYLKTKLSSNKWFDKEVFKDVSMKPVVHERPRNVADTPLNKNPFSCKTMTIEENIKRLQKAEMNGVDGDNDSDGDYEDVDDQEDLYEDQGDENYDFENEDEQNDDDDDIYIDKNML